MLSEYLISFTSNLNVIVRKVAGDNNLSLSQYFTLLNISSSGVLMGELSKLVGVEKSTLTRNIQILLNRNLVAKNQSEADKREYIIMLTPDGEKLIDILDRDMDNELNNILDNLDLNSKQKLSDIIESLNWKMNCYINEL
tara:strand:- start:1363 stop:1782 length:420 start_codon:yes stop_codon:yes gene_type:complete